MAGEGQSALAPLGAMANLTALLQDGPNILMEAYEILRPGEPGGKAADLRTGVRATVAN